MNTKKILLLLIVTSLIGAFFAFDLTQYVSMDYFQAQQNNIQQYYDANPIKSILIYLLLYIVFTALSLPGAVIMTLVGGAIFGLMIGTIVISFASTIGATLAFLVARYLLRDTTQGRFGDRLNTINQGIKKEGAFYLFTLRLIPLFPFFIINLVMGLTPMRTATYFIISQIGMLPGTLVFVNAGTQIAKIDNINDILSPALLFSFVLLGLFPLLAKKIIGFIKSHALLKQYPKPKQFDRNIIVIGGGSAGLVTAYISAAIKAKVTLIEKHKMGGDCLNTGCVPSKALIRSAKFINQVSRAKEYGIHNATADFEFADVMERIQRVISTVAPHDSAERYTELGVDVIQGAATITSPYTVEVNGRTLTTRNIVIATGARPFVPPIPGIGQTDYLTSDTIWDLRERPKRLLILGGGPIGCELSQAFARLGCHVTQVEQGNFLMAREDRDVSEMVMKRFINEGIDVRVEHTAKAFQIIDGEHQLVCEHNNEDHIIPFDKVLIAVGRQANTTGFGLETLNIKKTARNTIEVNEYLQTNYPNIYACGDVAGPYQFTHTAAHQAWYVAVNALFRGLKSFQVDYSIIPWATFTDPEVARVGLNEKDAQEKNIPYEVSHFDIGELDRAIADEEAHGFIKVLTRPGKDKILGVTIVGDHAGDLIAEYVMAMKHNLGLNKILGTIHIYPTLAESNKYVAGVWKRAHTPKTLLQWVKRFHAWRRH